MLDEPVILTTTRHSSDVAQILYGLELRGFKAQAHRTMKNKLGYQILLVEGDPDAARQAIPVIWDAILAEIPRCVSLNGACLFCGHGVAGLSKPVICPECGRSLDTIKARKAIRDGVMPKPEDTRDQD